MTRRQRIILFALPLVIVGTLRVALPHMTHAQVASVRLAQENESGENEGAGEDNRQPTVTAPVPTGTTTPTPAQPNVTNAAPAANQNANAPTGNGDVNTPVVPTYTSVDTADEAGASTDTERAPIISTAFPWAWAVTRAAGIVSYILLGLLSLTGMLLSTGSFFRAFEPATAWSIHRAIASTLLISVCTHVGALLFDKFINLHILDVLVPFVSPYRPLLVALGIAGFYLLLLVLATSLYTMNRWPRFWRIIHYFSFVMFISIFFHGLLIGTDRNVWWIQTIYWSTAALVVGLGAYRLWWKHHSEPASASAKA